MKYEKLRVDSGGNMSTQVERLEHNMVKLTVEVAAEAFEKAVRAA